MSRGKDLVGNNRAANSLYMQCKRAKRTTSFSTQATVDIDSLFTDAQVTAADCTTQPTQSPTASNGS